VVIGLRTVAVALFVFLCCYGAFSRWVPQVGHVSAHGLVGGHCYQVAAFSSLIDGTAHKPFVARMLVFSYLKVAARVVDTDVVVLLEGIFRALDWERLVYSTAYVDRTHLVLWYAMILLSFLLLIEGMRRFLGMLYEAPNWARICWGAVVVLIWPMGHAYYAYPYDPFTPTLFCWTLYLACRGYRFSYLALLLLAAVHKETAVAIPLAVAYMEFGRKPMGRLLLTTAAAVGAVLAIRLFISYVVYADSVGLLVGWHLVHNLNPRFLATFSPTAALILLLVYGLGLRDWRQRPVAARGAFLVVVPLLALALPFGLIDEIRQYAECLPGLFALAFPTVLGGLVPIVQRPDGGPLQQPTRPWHVLLLVALWLPVAAVAALPRETFIEVRRIELSELQEVKRMGTPRRARDVTQIPAHTWIEIPTELEAVSGIDASLDCNDRYRIVLRRGAESQEHLFGPKDRSCRGLARYRLKLKRPFERPDRVVVSPVTGDGLYALGHLRLAKSEAWSAGSPPAGPP